LAPIRGRAHSFQQRYNYKSGLQTWLFRIEIYNAEGMRERTIQVQMRGFVFNGTVLHGDWLQVTGDFENGLLVTESLFNETTNSSVWSTRHMRDIPA
jgi:hypothetical protein